MQTYCEGVLALSHPARLGVPDNGEFGTDICVKIVFFLKK